jgi:hypothetical protein
VIEIDVDLTVVTDSAVYQNATNYWANLDENRSKWNKEWQSAVIAANDYKNLVLEPFHLWLASQGATVSNNKKPTDLYMVDSYNIAQGIDVLLFDTEQNKLMFLLRWS